MYGSNSLCFAGQAKAAVKRWLELGARVAPNVKGGNVADLRVYTCAAVMEDHTHLPPFYLKTGTRPHLRTRAKKTEKLYNIQTMLADLSTAVDLFPN